MVRVSAAAILCVALLSLVTVPAGMVAGPAGAPAQPLPSNANLAASPLYERTYSLANGSAESGAPAWDGLPVYTTAYDPFMGVDYLSAGGLYEVDPASGRLTPVEESTQIEGVAFDARANMVFAAAGAPARLLGFDPTTGAVRANYSLPGNLSYTVTGITYDSALDSLYVVIEGNKVVALNATSGAVERTATVGGYVIATALDPTDGLLFAGDEVGGYVTALHTSTFASAANLTVGGPVAGLAYDSVNDSVGVSLAPSTDLFLTINAAALTVGSSHALDGGSTVLGPVAFDRTDDLFGVAVQGGPTFTAGFVDLVAGATLTQTAVVPVCTAPDTITYDGGYDRFDVGSQSAPSLTEVDPVRAAVAGAINLGTEPVALAVDDAHGLVYVANAQLGTVSIVRETNGRIVGSFPVGADPDAIAIDSVTGAVYVANSFSNNVTVYSPTLGHTIGSFAVPNGATALAFDGTTRQLFVTGYASDVTPIDTLTGTVGALMSTASDVFPVAAVIAPAQGELFVVELGGFDVSVFRISNDAYVGTVPAGLEPLGATLDPLTGDIYVANVGGNISVIDPTTLRDVGSISPGAEPTSIGLGSNGTLWVGTVLPLRLLQIDPTTNATLARLPGVEYAYAAAYSPATATTYFADIYASALTTIGPTPPPPPTEYSVRILESGLPVGTSWSLRVTNDTGVAQVYATTTTGVSVNAPNGTLSVSVAPSSGWTPTPQNFTVVVAGAAQVVNVSFSGGIPPPNRTVTFTETGLPAGERWSLFVQVGESAVPVNATGGVPASLELPEGTYAYSVGALASWSPSPAAGTFTLASGPTNVTVAFATTTPAAAPAPAAAASSVPVQLAYLLVAAVIVLVLALAYLVIRRPPAPPRPPEGAGGPSPGATGQPAPGAFR